MSDKSSGVTINFGWLGIVILLVAFWGEPDLVDSAISYLNEPNPIVTEVETLPQKNQYEW